MKVLIYHVVRNNDFQSVDQWLGFFAKNNPDFMGFKFVFKGLRYDIINLLFMYDFFEGTSDISYDPNRCKLYLCLENFRTADIMSNFEFDALIREI